MDAPATWPALIGALIKGETLTSAQTSWAMSEIMEGAATPTQIAGFGVALRMKGETPGEVSGLAAAMLDHATPISVPGPLVDLVGTGGTGRTRSTSPPWGPSSPPRQAPGWPSTATARPAPPAARRTCWRH